MTEQDGPAEPYGPSERHGPSEPHGPAEPHGPDESHGPAEAARRALREARERGGATPESAQLGEERGADESDAGEAHRHGGTADAVEETGQSQSEPQPPSRPGDVARAALRRAVAQRRTAAVIDEAMAEAPSPAERPTETAATHADAEASDTDTAGRPGTVGQPPGTATADEASGTRADEETPDTGTTPPAPPPTPGSATPADRAREALRAARAEARRKAEADEPGGASPARRRPSRSAAPPAARQRTQTSGDAAAQRARELRQLLSGAFRMPTDASPEEPAEGTDSPAAQQSRTPAPPSAEPHPAHADDDAPANLPPAETPTHRPPAETPARPPAAAPSPASRAHGEAAPASYLPRSMAAPARDGDLRRTFPAFAPRPTGGDTRFAETWWGNAWVTALEEGALDPKRLARGRGYAEQGHVDAITVTPGSVLAYVQGSRPRPYRVQVRLRTLGDDDWARFLDAAAERPGHIAALLDKEMPHSLADCGVPLLPEPGDLEPRCSCPDRGHPCKHAAALCYQTARLLDADPFVLLLLRGRGERELLDALARLSATRAARAAQDREPAPLPGVRATEVFAERQRPPLPEPLPLPPYPEQPPVYPAAPGGPDPIDLDQLATDAAARAHALLATGEDEVGRLTLWQDAVRLAAARPGSGLTAGSRALYSSLATAVGRTPAELARAVAAWRQGGLDGLAVLEEPWDPPAGRFDRARPALLAADLPAFRPWRNRLTHPRGHVQLRLGQDGLWYAYESEPDADDWWPRGTPDPDPVGALTGLGTADDA
ncbi:SWIM zinc finger family protein [Streptomyces sp. NPDC003299]